MKSRPIIAPLLCTAALFAGSAHGANPTPPAVPEATLPKPAGHEKLDEAAKLMRAGKYQEALDLLDILEKAGHPPSQIYNLQGAVATQLRNFKRARIAFTNALDSATNDAEREHPMFNLAEIDFVEKKFPASYEGFNKLLKQIKSAETKGIIQFKLYICETMQSQQEAAQQRMRLMPPDSAQRDYAGVVLACTKGDTKSAQSQLDDARKTHGEKLAGVYCDALIEMGWTKRDGKTIIEKE